MNTMKQRTEAEKLQLLQELVNTVTRNAHRQRSTNGEHRLIKQVAQELIGRTISDEELRTHVW